MKPNDILFARQPIFDLDNHLYGFELLYRGVDNNRAIFENANNATCELLVNYCSGVLDDDQAPPVKIFINLTRNLILSEFFFPLDPTRIVIEILEDVTVDQRLIDKVIELKKKGYQFALDDYEFESRFEPLLPLVSYIKIELLHISNETLQKKFVHLKQYYQQSKTKTPHLLAEKVETKEQYDFCQGLGFDMFQGYFLERPQMVYGKKISHSSESALHIVAKMQEANLVIDELCHVISTDTKLSYQLLKIVNSPLCRVPRKVSSLKEAVVFLGLGQVKKWAMALVLSGSSSQSSELFRILMTRARTCELYAEEKGYDFPERFFMTGLFSGIDAVMLADKKWLVEKLDLIQEVHDALLKESGVMGKTLAMVTALEHSDWSMTNELNEKDQITLFTAHESAINWAHQLCCMI